MKNNLRQGFTQHQFIKKIFGDHGKGLKTGAGFTLIEMLVVVAIISILAGVVLTGVTGFQASARDTRRIAELKLVQNYLEQYAQRHGHYPGDADGGAPVNINTWSSLQTSLAGLSITLPNDPVAGRTYYYATDADNLRYLLGAKLEGKNNAMNNLQEIDTLTMPAGITPPAGLNCNDDDANLGYCIAS